MIELGAENGNTIGLITKTVECSYQQLKKGEPVPKYINGQTNLTFLNLDECQIKPKGMNI